MQTEQPNFSSKSSTEVSSKATRRRFSAEYKTKVLEEARACTQHGALGALLRREGLYSSHLASWRIAHEERGSAGLSPQTPGPKPRVSGAKDAELIASLERDKRRLEQRLLHAEAIIEIQKKLSSLLGVQLPEPPDDER